MFSWTFDVELLSYCIRVELFLISIVYCNFTRVQTEARVIN
jgi:hypothetical protein